MGRLRGSEMVTWIFGTVCKEGEVLKFGTGCVEGLGGRGEE